MSLISIERRMAQFEAAPSAPDDPADAASFDRLARADASADTAPPAGASAAGGRAQPNSALVQRAAAAQGVDPALVFAVIANESGFDSGATSPAGAMGLMQLMPQTARALGVSDPYDPAQNIAGGTAYLRSLLDRFGGNTALAVAAYNAGPGAVESSGGIPPFAETQRYVSAVLAQRERWRTR